MSRAVWSTAPGGSEPGGRNASLTVTSTPAAGGAVTSATWAAPVSAAVAVTWASAARTLAAIRRSARA
ncbi:hypothetical protein [Micromonospora sp. LH3U1]|uniref:hypothetical protein n=1 Tax=Micromonospora sp. LH3U1 TaxID=3018339 RepID=UPI00234ACEC4|nr:hypothetical protein [Micromonospora sp. LH3U1]WCN78927.1 hypothetical protein PCA76_18030 [Micromonospora sp. LH3U1]